MKTIKELREYSGFSQRKFSSEYHIPMSNLLKWEHEKEKCPNYLAEYLEQVIVDKKSKEEAALSCYTPNVLTELGHLYKELCVVTTKGINYHHNPYPYAYIRPIQAFTMVYINANKGSNHIPKSLEKQIAMFMDCINAQEWGDLMDTPVPLQLQQYFVLGMGEITA